EGGVLRGIKNHQTQALPLYPDPTLSDPPLIFKHPSLSFSFLLLLLLKKKRDKIRNPHFPLPDLFSLNNQAHISNSFLSSF
ncbi:hypothetical protein G4B88_015662, partial [Cannabis sativa]